MVYNSLIPKDIEKAKNYLDQIISRGSKFELKKIVNYRTALQNRALHKFFGIIADRLNDLGHECIVQRLDDLVGMPYTTNLVKENVWKVVQIDLFDIESTTKINTEQINQIADVIIKFYAEKGIIVDFPRKELKELKELENNQK